MPFFASGPGRPYKHDYGDIIRFTYDPQDRDDATGDPHKEVLVLHPFWNNKLQGIDLKRLSPNDRGILEAILDPETYDKPHKLPIVNDIRKRLDPMLLVRNPQAFYSRFIKQFLPKRGIDAYRQYIPRRMSNITRIRQAKIMTGKPPVRNPLFPPKGGEDPLIPQHMKKGMTVLPQAGFTPADLMKMAAAKRGAQLPTVRKGGVIRGKILKGKIDKPK
jgi:hypothetical protein